MDHVVDDEHEGQLGLGDGQGLNALEVMGLAHGITAPGT
jgi:hypothetical protein